MLLPIQVYGRYAQVIVPDNDDGKALAIYHAADADWIITAAAAAELFPLRPELHRKMSIVDAFSEAGYLTQRSFGVKGKCRVG
jgi:predicted nucleic acid-binding protein